MNLITKCIVKYGTEVKLRCIFLRMSHAFCSFPQRSLVLTWDRRGRKEGGFTPTGPHRAFRFAGRFRVAARGRPAQRATDTESRDEPFLFFCFLFLYFIFVSHFFSCNLFSCLFFSSLFFSFPFFNFLFVSFIFFYFLFCSVLFFSFLVFSSLLFPFLFFYFLLFSSILFYLILFSLFFFSFLFFSFLSFPCLVLSCLVFSFLFFSFFLFLLGALFGGLSWSLLKRLGAVLGLSSPLLC